ncbi:hypothetical protein [Natrinema sp. 74]|uniref:DUF7524 family protein n=1 Tax=Natrinema sp. 74 TaxID=3384159 RepID=UPI0038D4F896
MSDSEVTVHVNRSAADELEASSATLDTTGSFALRLQGHESPAHVHCRLGGDLERIASVDQSNYYVEPNAVTAVPITVDADGVERPVEGTLEVLTGYGSNSVSIAVTITAGPPGVAVDETLAEPARREPDPTALERVVDRLTGVSALEPATIAVLGLGLVAIGIAAATAATITSPIATAGLGIVIAGVVVAVLLLIW